MTNARLKRLPELLATILIVAMLSLFIAWTFAPRLLGLTPQIILTGSMEPELKVGALAFVEEVAPESVRVGDVITFRHPLKATNPPTLVTHRVVEVSAVDGGRFTYRTRGDANATADSWVVSSSNLTGKVKFSIPEVGVWSERLRTPMGFVLVIGLPALYVMLTEVQGLLALRRPAASSANTIESET